MWRQSHDTNLSMSQNQSEIRDILEDIRMTNMQNQSEVREIMDDIRLNTLRILGMVQQLLAIAQTMYVRSKLDDALLKTLKKC